MNDLLKRSEAILKDDYCTDDHEIYEGCIDCERDAKRLIKELSDKLKEREWQPISGAPKDGAWYLFCDATECSDRNYNSSPAVYKWYADIWEDSEGESYLSDIEREFTHFMPLPSIPRGDSK